jgi:site-specific recombinase XerD
VFTSERGAPFTTAGWRKMVARLGVAAKFSFKAHPHMFRHTCGFTNQGTDTRTLQAYLGHRTIQHTVRYTELSPTRFKNLWRLPDFRLQMSRIVAWLAFGSGKARGASNIGGLSDTE